MKTMIQYTIQNLYGIIWINGTDNPLSTKWNLIKINLSLKSVWEQDDLQFVLLLYVDSSVVLIFPLKP